MYQMLRLHWERYAELMPVAATMDLCVKAPEPTPCSKVVRNAALVRDGETATGVALRGTESALDVAPV